MLCALHGLPTISRPSLCIGVAKDSDPIIILHDKREWSNLNTIPDNVRQHLLHVARRLVTSASDNHTPVMIIMQNIYDSLEQGFKYNSSSLINI